MFHLIHPDVVHASRRVPGLVGDEAVRAHGVLDFGGVPSCLSRIVRLFHVLPLAPQDLPLGRVGQADESGEKPLKLLKGGHPPSPRRASPGWKAPCQKGSRPVQGARHRGLALPEDPGRHVLRDVRPVAEPEENRAIPQAEREPAVDPDPAHAWPFGEPLTLLLEASPLQLCVQEIEFLEGDAREHPESFGVPCHILKSQHAEWLLAILFDRFGALSCMPWENRLIVNRFSGSDGHLLNALM